MLSRRAVLGGMSGGAAFTLLADRADAAPAIGQTLAQGLVIPWGLAFLPTGDALVSERESGAVHLVSRTGGREQVGVIACDGAAEGEGGLLGAALSPSFGQDQQVFFYRTFGGVNQVVRATYASGDLGSPTVILSGIPAGRIHNGGRIRFGPDGKLYVGTGEAGNKPLAQQLDSLGGKILRINRDGSAPASNPFSGGANRRRVWTRGHRNVQGLAWDGRGRMFATELGESIRDELNHIVERHNYGWPVVEGGDGSGPFHDPFVTWANEDCSPSGLAILRNRAWVGALRGQALWSVDLVGPTARRKTRYFHQQLGRIRTVERAPDGSLWVTTSNRTGSGAAVDDDRVVRIVF